MKTIVTKNGKEVYVDEIDYELLKDYKWYCVKEGYCMTVINKIPVKMHRLIMGDPKGKIVDHIDTNPYNNQRNNLRIVTHFENAQNRKKNKNKSESSYKGFFFSKQMNCWISQLICYNQKYFIGYFKTEIAAAHAYNKKAKEVSKFVFLNKIDMPEEELDFILELDRIEKFKKVAEKQSQQEGVYWHAPRNKQKHGMWEVKMIIYGKRRNVGTYFREEDAIKAYKAAEKELKRTKQLTIDFE